MSDAQVTVTGNICRPGPELRFTPQGHAVCEFSIRVPGKKAKGDQPAIEASFRKVVVWRELAENVAESLSEGDRVFVQGPVKVEQWTDKNTQEPRSQEKITGYVVAVDLNYATVQVARIERSDGATGAPSVPATTPAGDYEPF